VPSTDADSNCAVAGAAPVSRSTATSAMERNAVDRITVQASRPARRHQMLMLDGGRETVAGPVAETCDDGATIA